MRHRRLVRDYENTESLRHIIEAEEVEPAIRNEPAAQPSWVAFIWGGSNRGSPRKLNVSLVFQLDEEGRVYLAGYCPEREANRVFCLDLVMVLCAWN
jgi:hypothetical protein